MTRRLFRPAPILTMVSLLGVLLSPGISRAEAVLEGRVVFSDPPGGYEVEYAGEGDNVVVRVGGHPVSDKMIRTYIATYGASAHGGAGGEEKVPADFIKRELIVRDVIDSGRARNPESQKMIRIFYLSSLGADFRKNGIGERVAVTADEVARELPKRFVVGEFDLLQFGTEEEAKKSAEHIRTLSEFDEYAAKNPKALKKIESLQPGSGFFHAFDDLDLFQFKQERVAGYLETGIGPCVVAVRSVRELSEHEKGILLLKIENQIRDRKIEQLVGEIYRKYPFRVDRNVLEILTDQDVKKENLDRDTVIGEVGGIPITYGEVDAWIPRDYKRWFLGIKGEALAKFLFTDAENLCRTISLGLEASGSGISLTDENFRKAFDEYKRRYYLQIGIRDLLREEPLYTDEETRKYFNKNRQELFDIPEKVEAAQIFTRSKDKAEKLERLVKEGNKFEVLAASKSEDEKSNQKGGYLGNLPNHPSLIPEVRKVLFEKKWEKDSVTPIVQTDLGFHFFKVYRYTPGKKVKYEAVKQSVREKMKNSWRETKMEVYEKTLRGKYRVEIDSSAMLAITGKQGKKPQRHH